MKVLVYFFSLVVTILCIALASELALEQLLPDAYRGYLVEVDDEHLKWTIGPYEPSRPSIGFNPPVTKKKPADTLRIVSLGASGTEGWLSAETVFKKYGQKWGPKNRSSYSQATEFSLNKVADRSAKKVEVINLGIAAYNIMDVIRMLKDSIQLDPDLFLIQIGGNETWTSERLDWSSYLSDDIPYLYLELGYELFTDTQGGWGTLSGGESAFNPMALFSSPRPRPIFNEPPGRTEGLEQRLRNYRDGLDNLGDFLQARNIPVLFLVPTQNLADFQPFGSMAKPGTSDQQLEELNQLLIAALHERGPESKNKYLEILEIDDGIAEANFQLGKIYLHEQEPDLAREHFWKANDRDIVLKRLPSAFHDISRDFVARYDFPYIDVMKFYESKSSDGVVGYNWLDDDVHPHRQAQFDLGVKLAELIIDRDLLQGKNYSGDLQQLPNLGEYNAWTGFDQESVGIISYLGAAHNFLTFGRFKKRLGWDPEPEVFLAPIINRLNTAIEYAPNDSPLYLNTALQLILGEQGSAEAMIDRLDCGSSPQRAAQVRSAMSTVSFVTFGRSNKELNSKLQGILDSKGCIE